jgi:hypothetical protein
MENPLLCQQKGNQQATKAPIAVEERMNAFELDMGQADLNQGRQSIFFVEK